MSTRSNGPHLLAPDMPVKAHSEELESYFEQLHRLVYRNASIPLSLNSAFVFVQQGNQLFYLIRDLLEQDFGVSQQVARALPTPEVSSLLAICDKYSDSLEGHEIFLGLKSSGSDFLSSNTVIKGQFSSSDGFWKTLGFTMWSFTRCLRIVQRRIFPLVAESYKETYRFQWLQENGPELEDPSHSLDSLFFPLPQTCGLQADPFLWIDLAEAAAVKAMPQSQDELEIWINQAFLERVGQKLISEGQVIANRYSPLGMSDNLVSMDWWFEVGRHILLNRWMERHRNRT